MRSSTIRYLLLVLALAGLVVMLLQASPLYFVHGLGHYLPLHVLMETASIVVAFLVFGVVWNAYSAEQPGNIVLLATGLMAAGLLDFAHMLSFKGMPDFVTPGSPEKAINFWLLARLLTALTFLIAAVRPWRPLATPLRRYQYLLASLLFVAASYWGVLHHQDAWPHTFIEGEGLTSFKVHTEYLVIGLFTLSAILLGRNAWRSPDSVSLSLAAAAATSMLSELCFTVYTEVSDVFNLLGHIYKIIAFLLVYNSVFIKSIRLPYERLRAEEQALEESQHRLQTVISTALDGIVVADAESKRFLLANRAFCKMLGVSQNTLTAMRVEEIHPAEQLAHVLDQFERQLRGELTIAEDIPVLRPDGTIFYADFNSSALVLDGRPALMATVRDTSERRQMEHELAASRERVELAIEGAQDGLFDWDIEQKKVYYSPRWKLQLGYREEELGNSYDEWSTRLHPDDRLEADEAIQTLLKGDTERLELEYRLRHRDGQWLWFLARGHAICDRQGCVVRMVGTQMDITEIKLAQLSEEEAREQLRERLKELQCLYRVSALQNEVKRPVGELLQQAADYLPPALLYPDQAVARIRFDKDEFHTAGFMESKNQLQASLMVDGITRGDITFGYLSPQTQTADEIAFLREEHSLIEAIAVQLGTLIEQHNSQSLLMRTNRILSTLSKSNRSLVHAISEQELSESMCRILVEEGGYTRAWVGYLDAEHKQLTQQAVVQAEGVELSALNAATLSDDNALLATVIREGKAQTHSRLDPGSCHLQECNGNQSLCSNAIALPLKAASATIGAMVVCGPEHTVMEPQEIELFEELAEDLSFGITNLRTRGERDKAVGALEGMLFQTIDAIARTLEKRDPYTAGHQHRVAQLAEAIGRDMGLSEFQLTGLQLGSTIHDIGKVYIPSELLNRPGRLTADEFALIKSHPSVGYDIIKDIQFPWPVVDMIRHHHERLDGSGYPDGLKGDEIRIETRILAVADVVEAITSHRPYRAALGIDKALEVIEQGRERHFDPDVVDSCIHLFKEKGFRWQEPGSSTERAGAY